MSSNLKKDELGIIITVILQILFIFIIDMYGPYGLLFVVNNYLENVCFNHSILAQNPKQISNLNESLAKIDYDQMYRSFSSLILNVEKLPDASKIDPSLAGLTKPEEWKFFGLFLMGRAVEKNIKNRLDVSQILHGIKNVWNVYITLLKPKARITPHKSITKGLLRYMMPFDRLNLLLEIFEDIPIEHEEFEGKKAKSRKILMDKEIIFDPTVIHSIYNQGSSWCMILVIDIIRPLEGFAFGVNRMSLGLSAKHQLTDYALQMAECDF